MTSCERGRGLHEQAEVGIIIPDAEDDTDVSYRRIVEPYRAKARP